MWPFKSKPKDWKVLYTDKQELEETIFTHYGTVIDKRRTAVMYALKYSSSRDQFKIDVSGATEYRNIWCCDAYQRVLNKEAEFAKELLHLKKSVEQKRKEILN